MRHFTTLNSITTLMAFKIEIEKIPNNTVAYEKIIHDHGINALRYMIY